MMRHVSGSWFELTNETLDSRPQWHLTLLDHFHEQIRFQQVELLDQLLLLTWFLIVHVTTQYGIADGSRTAQ